MGLPALARGLPPRDLELRRHPRPRRRRRGAARMSPGQPPREGDTAPAAGGTPDAPRRPARGGGGGARGRAGWGGGGEGRGPRAAGDGEAPAAAPPEAPLAPARG